MNGYKPIPNTAEEDKQRKEQAGSDNAEILNPLEGSHEKFRGTTETAALRGLVITKHRQGPTIRRPMPACCPTAMSGIRKGSAQIFAIQS
jgi:hypothetical protein